MAPHFELERAALESGRGPVCGVDEAGRGPWAGPVVAAAVIFDPDDIPEGINDSKRLSHEIRCVLFDQIIRRARFATGIAEVERIDRDNILAANDWAMAEAVRNLPVAPQLALVDGNRAPPLPCQARAVIGGDSICLSIAAASIIAKVTRDRLMVDIDRQWPGYGFAQHKGYGTPAHQRALRLLGPCAQHRRSFAPIRNLIR